MLASTVPAPPALGWRAPDVFVWENEPFAYVTLHRFDISKTETMRFTTSDGSAKAGVDYVATSGPVTFPPGQSQVTVAIPLIDNGLVDRDRLFFADHDGDPEPNALVLIVDNEVPESALNVDASFVPEVSRDELSYSGNPPWPLLPRVMPDGRLLVPGGLHGKAMTMLMPDGSIDKSFKPPPEWRPLEVLPDGRIWAGYDEFILSRLPLLLLRPDGSVEAEVIAPVRPGALSQTAVQNDGKLLIMLWRSLLLQRLNLDGTIDPSFQQGVFSDGSVSITVQSDNKILLAGSFLQFNGEDHQGLVRLNPDGSIDLTFSAVLTRQSPDGPRNNVVRAFQRKNGKIVIAGELMVINGTPVNANSLIQLNTDGTLDTGFKSDLEFIPSTNPQILEQPDGFLLLAHGSVVSPYGSLVRLKTDGSRDQTFGEIRLCCGGSEGGYLAMALTKQGELLLDGRFRAFRAINGFQRPGLVRFLNQTPARNFQVLTPAELCSDGAVRIKIMRAGETSKSASIEFATRDFTATAGRDYQPQTGTLQFDPLEVTKDIRIPLVRNPGLAERLSLRVALSNPSSGYETPPPVPVAIPPPLSLEIESLAGFYFALRVHGTISGKAYRLEMSTDLRNWSLDASRQAEWITVGFFTGGLPHTFYRVVGKGILVSPN